MVSKMFQNFFFFLPSKVASGIKKNTVMCALHFSRRFFTINFWTHAQRNHLNMIWVWYRFKFTSTFIYFFSLVFILIYFFFALLFDAQFLLLLKICFDRLHWAKASVIMWNFSNKLRPLNSTRLMNALNYVRICENWAFHFEINVKIKSRILFFCFFVEHRLPQIW